MTSSRPHWSTELVRDASGGVPALVYTEREHNVSRFLDIAVRWGDRTHLVQGRRRLGLDGLRRVVEAGAGLLSSEGLVPGQRVLVLGWNSIEWVIAFWSVLRAGGVVVTGNRWWSDDELAHSIALSAPSLVLSDRGPSESDDESLRWIGLDLLRAPDGGSPPPPRPPTDEYADAMVMFTSGSTGFPKGAVFSHRALIAGLHSQLHLTHRLPQELSDDHPAEITLQTSPFFHIGGVQAIMRAALLGGTLVLTEGRFEPKKVLDLIVKEGVQRWAAVPTVVSRVLDDESLPGRDLSRVRSVTLGGAPTPAGLMDRVRAAFPSVHRRLGTGWGLTEAGGQLTAASGADTLEHPGTVGRPLPFVELRIRRPDAAGEGEIVARSPMQMSRYVGTPSATPIDSDGWLSTGDLGRLDTDGRLWLTGRSKDVIVRGGENVAAPRVEEVLLTHPSVAEAAVLGMPDPDLGEEVAAVVVTRDHVSPDELRAHVRGQLSRFAVPTRWWLRRDPLPVNDVGKVLKPQLRTTWPDEEAM